MTQWGVTVLAITVPEPSTLVLLAIAGMSLAGHAYRKRKRVVAN